MLQEMAQDHISKDHSPLNFYTFAGFFLFNLFADPFDPNFKLAAMEWGGWNFDHIQNYVLSNEFSECVIRSFVVAFFGLLSKIGYDRFTGKEKKP